jgi:hypothetical protein
MVDLIYFELLEFYFRKMSLPSALQYGEHSFALQPLVEAGVRDLAGRPFE